MCKYAQAPIKQTITAPTNQGQWIIYLKVILEHRFSLHHLHAVCRLLFLLSLFQNYFKILNNKLARDTRMDVAENHKLVLFPISEFRALALFGVT